MIRTCTTLAILAIAGSAAADFAAPDAPSWRGDAGTAYYGWESFSAPYGAPNFNDSGDAGGMLFNFGPGAVITGDGNLYNPTGGLNIHVYGYGPLEQAVLNISTFGTEIDYDGLYLAVGDGENPYEYFSADAWVINFYEEIPGMGAAVNASFTFDLGDYDQPIAEWGFVFASNASHTSLDAVMVDVHMGAVPGAGTLALLGIAGLARRRRN